jgi:uncharacterized membrane protein YgaE (UPF0421/DUF939 family)
MKRKAPLFAGIAVLAAVIALFGVLGKQGSDVTWGAAVGLGIAAVVTWIAERE